jgi:hypothetical protein
MARGYVQSERFRFQTTGTLFEVFTKSHFGLSLWLSIDCQC